MASPPTIAMHVRDLDRSLHFYVDLLGFRPAERLLDAGVAVLVDPDGDPLLLAGPNVGDVKPYLAGQHRVLAPGDTLGFGGDDLDARRVALEHDGVERIEITEKRWGDRTLRVHDPDGYVLDFYQRVHHTPEEWMALYRSGVEELESAVAGLDDSDLDWAPAPGAWGVRQIVHHIADGDALFLLPMRMAIAEPGRTFVYNWPKDNASYGENLCYGERDIVPSLALLRAIRTHMLQLMHAVPDIWTRSIVDENGRVWNFERFIRLLTGHALEHVDEILEIRRMHALGV